LADVRRKLDSLHSCLLPVEAFDADESGYVNNRFFKEKQLPKIAVAFSGGMLVIRA
jgi:hypothetical protein